MGDDTHMSEKIREPRHRDPEKAGRELGIQPAWEDPAVERRLRNAGIDRKTIIEKYVSRIS